MNDLDDLLEAQLGRRVKAQELADALGVSRATYQRAKAAGLDANQLIQIAQHFDLNPALVLIDMGVLTGADVAGAVDAYGVSRFSDLQMLHELFGRALERDVADRGVTNPSNLGFTRKDEADLQDLVRKARGQ